MSVTQIEVTKATRIGNTDLYRKSNRKRFVEANVLTTIDIAVPITDGLGGPLTPEDGNMYSLNVQLQSSPESNSVIFDSGSVVTLEPSWTLETLVESLNLHFGFLGVFVAVDDNIQLHKTYVHSFDTLEVILGND